MAPFSSSLPSFSGPSRPLVPYTFTFTDPERRVFRPREVDPATGRPLTVSQWAARYRRVTTGRMQGLWNNNVTPYAVEPMDLWTTPHVQKIFLIWPPQSSKTQIALNCIAYAADQDPGPLMYVNPDEKLARRVSKRRIQPMFEQSLRLSSLLSPRSEDNTLFMIRLLNGMDIMLPWASSAAELSAEEARYMIFEETDKYQDSIGREGREGDVISYGEMRQNTYPHPKNTLFISSPSAFPSRITALVKSEADEIRRYYARCPFCAHPQIMDDDHIVLAHKTTDPRVILREKLGRYACDKCAFVWDDYSRDQAVRNGYWQADLSVIRPTAVAFLLAAWYSPEISLSVCAADKLRAQQDPTRTLFYFTQRRGEEYTETIAAKTKEKILAHRVRGYNGIDPIAALPPKIVPAEAIALTVGIDMQKHGFYFVVDAWAENFDSWMIDYGQLTTWDDLESLIWQATYHVEGSPDQVMSIWRAAMDTGGGKTDNVEITRTEEAYEWLRRQIPGRIFGIKGMSRPQLRRIKPSVIDKFPHSNHPIPGGLELRLIDSGQFKLLFHQRLDRDPAEMGQHVYLHAETGLDFARQILAEELRRKGNGHPYWYQIHQANHYLDCKAYSAACVDSEWHVSFQVLARALKEQHTRVSSPPLHRTEEPRRDPREILEHARRDGARPGWLTNR